MKELSKEDQENERILINAYIEGDVDGEFTEEDFIRWSDINPDEHKIVMCALTKVRKEGFNEAIEEAKDCIFRLMGDIVKIQDPQGVMKLLLHNLERLRK